ncbi:Peroxiredoxin [Flaviramulus basaltis]|uniref:Peroxiredoxin n=1 Tax=Flaviramulus basaltis TaxID=369401 RepID=A0A1K2IKY2_9FLAO|nr:TlpA disulfide reductase family protein [Flaviramulus basaltis]SFZ93084.1 Peroxiredoxin [Flaviramulus basaltis]
MKQIVLLIFCSVLVMGCAKEKTVDGYQISGTLKGIDSGWAKIIKRNMIDRQKMEVIDSVAITKSSFYFEGKTEAQDMATLNINDNYNVDFFLENTLIKVVIDIAADKQNKRPTPIILGSTMYDQVLKQGAIRDSIFNNPKFDRLKEISESYQAARAGNDTLKMEEYKTIMYSPDFQNLSKERTNEMRKAIFNFVEQNPSSPVSPNIMGFQYTEGRMTKDELKKYYDIYEGDAKKTAFFQFFNKIHDEVFNKFSVGAVVPDFTLTTVDGKGLTLSKVEGKYILIDFWASWCVPCRASFPHLKELYKQYKDKGFEVVAIGTADQEDKWRKAIEEDKTPWLHVYDANTKSKNMYGPVAQKYNVPHLPTTFLIDNKGVIILRQPQKEDLDKKLDELINHNN